MENTKNKEELIEELEAILKANKDNVYCDEYQIADMVREALKLQAASVQAFPQRLKLQAFPHKVQDRRSRVQAYLPLIRGTSNKDKCI